MKAMRPITAAIVLLVWHVLVILSIKGFNPHTSSTGRRRTPAVFKGDHQIDSPNLSSRVPSHILHLSSGLGDAENRKSKKSAKSKRNPATKNSSKKGEKKGTITKEELVKAVGEQISKIKSKETLTERIALPTSEDVKEKRDGINIIDRLNPFKAGQNLRQTIDTAIESMATTAAGGNNRPSIYYLDDRFSAGSTATSAASSALERLQDEFIPEVLVVGATGPVGQRIVRRLLLDGRFRVRVLVRDLYTKTLNRLGTGVTYCQGDLSNVDSLEFAVTDVDKIIFCLDAPRTNADNFVESYADFVQENNLRVLLNQNNQRNPSLLTATAKDSDGSSGSTSDLWMQTWQQLSNQAEPVVTLSPSIIDIRAQVARQIDSIGVTNLIQAFQNVRHADFGTSQAAKRSLFKFQDRPEDFYLFAVDEGERLDSSDVLSETDDDEVYLDETDEFDEGYDAIDSDDDDAVLKLETRRDMSVKVQTQWIRNQFEHGVFVGRVPKATATRMGGEAAVVSSRLRSRQDPENGIELGTGFGGFICRVCSDGGIYEAFVRTSDYYEHGIEYVCEFSTATKNERQGTNKSRNKFTTIRLPFECFLPVQQKSGGDDTNDVVLKVKTFRGSDVRNIGFRYRSSRNVRKGQLKPGLQDSFYLALSYIKLYRSQPEPEFVYVSDARIPPVVRSNMIRRNAARLVIGDPTENDVVALLDDTAFAMERTPEETYYKYRGEEILKNSGLNYAIVRVAGYNDLPTAELSTIDLQAANDGVTTVSRDELAQVCVEAVMNSDVLNKSFYITRKQSIKSQDEDMASKFKALPADMVV